MTLYISVFSICNVNPLSEPFQIILSPEGHSGYTLPWSITLFPMEGSMDYCGERWAKGGIRGWDWEGRNEAAAIL